MLKFYQSPDLRVLADKLIEIECNQINNVFSRSTIVVPNLATRDWLEQRIARHVGISAHTDYPFWIEFERSLIEKVYEQLVPQAGASDFPLSDAVMRWTVFAYLNNHLDNILDDPNHPLFLTLQFLITTREKSHVTQRLWTYAKETARIFTAYLQMRPEWLSQWSRGKGGCLEDFLSPSITLPSWLIEHYRQVLVAQQFLWQVCFSEAYLKREKMFDIFSQAAQTQNLPKVVVPQRLFIFGVFSLNASILNFLEILSSDIEVYLFHHSLSNEYFSDIVDNHWLRSLPFAKQEEYSSGHPLVSRFGKTQRDIQRLLMQREWSENIEYLPFQPAKSDSLLSRLHADIRYMREEATLGAEPLLSVEDDSLRIHACHGLLRQLEVLRGELVRWLNADSERKLSDILVVMPNPDQYQDMIRSVFPANSDYDGYYLPARITGISTPEAENLWQSVVGIYTLWNSTFDSQTVCDWLLLKDTCAAYGISHEAMQSICEKLIAAGFRRGFDQQHLQSQIDHQDDDDRYTFLYALDRLVAAYTMPDAEIFNDEVVPAEPLSSNDLSALQVLCQFAMDIREAQTQLQQESPALEWIEKLKERLETQFSYAVNTSGYQSIVHLLRDLKYQLGERITLPLPFDFVLNTISDRLSSQQPSSEPSGVITIGRLSALQGLPYKLIVFLNADADVFPSRTYDKRYNLIEISTPRPGDNHREQDELGAFLALIVNAQESCWIFYNAVDPVDNEARLPAAPVHTLIEYLTEQLGHQKFIITHESDPFHPDSNAAHPAPLWYKVQKTRLEFQNKSSSQWVEIPFIANRLEWANSVQQQQGIPRQTQNFSQLLTAILKPASTYLKNKNINLLKNTASPVTIEPLELDGLENWQINQRLLSTLDDTQKYNHFLREPYLPMNQFGQAYGKQQREHLNERREKLLEMSHASGLTKTEPQQIHFENWVLNAELPISPDKPWINLSVSKAKSYHLVRFRLHHLLWQYSGAYQESIWGFSDKENPIILPAKTKQQAQSELQEWLAIWQILQEYPWIVPIELLWEVVKKPELIDKKIVDWLKMRRPNEDYKGIYIYDDKGAWNLLFKGYREEELQSILGASINQHSDLILPFLEDKILD
ncbi:exodeoxyribonuclease V subunit gamma [Suttonella ornithocola]|uniref:Exodeoxyribonuclease V gamma chain n=1 Tax=Suttonella ornithocola TaxID=279832 RepID=A0A380MUJ3_9GAMM|nr:exodeoxyribonuclease V subunit gamma [Suttonella ornithocola]SUO95854.1 Exodeoxyribonuclease V gamma chain [Suttonella ornithocola]